MLLKHILAFCCTVVCEGIAYFHAVYGATFTNLQKRRRAFERSKIVVCSYHIHMSIMTSGIG